MAGHANPRARVGRAGQLVAMACTACCEHAGELGHVPRTVHSTYTCSLIFLSHQFYLQVLQEASVGTGKHVQKSLKTSKSL